MVEIGKGLEVGSRGEAAAPGSTRLRARGHTRPPRDELFRSKKYRPPVRTSRDLLLPLLPCFYLPPTPPPPPLPPSQRTDAGQLCWKWRGSGASRAGGVPSQVSAGEPAGR